MSSKHLLFVSFKDILHQTLMSSGEKKWLPNDLFICQMLHGKHVMVRVGGGWDTLRGFLMKYDPLRVLQFTTLEQKILAFQKGPPGLGGHHGNAAPPPPPDMDPLAAVNNLISTSASSSSSTSSSSSSSGSSPVAAAGQTCRSYTASPACTPTLPRKGAATAAKKNLQMTPSSPRKPTQLPLAVTTKGCSSLPATPVGSSSRQSPGPGGPGVQVQRRAVTPSAAPSAAPADPSPASKLKLRPSPRGAASQPRSPVCPEPSSKCPKPSSPCSSPTAASVPRPVTAAVRAPTSKDARPPTGASQRSCLAQRRPGSPASRLRLEAARRVRTATRAAATPTPQTRTPNPSSRTASPALPKPACSLPRGKEATAKAKGPAPTKAAPGPPRGTTVPGRVPGGNTGPSAASKANQKTPAAAQRAGRKQAAAANPVNGKSTLKPAQALDLQKTSSSVKAVQTEPSVAKKIPQCNSKRREDAYFEMNSRRRQRT